MPSMVTVLNRDDGKVYDVPSETDLGQYPHLIKVPMNAQGQVESGPLVSAYQKDAGMPSGSPTIGDVYRGMPATQADWMQRSLPGWANTAAHYTGLDTPQGLAISGALLPLGGVATKLGSAVQPLADLAAKHVFGGPVGRFVSRSIPGMLGDAALGAAGGGGLAALEGQEPIEGMLRGAGAGAAVGGVLRPVAGAVGDVVRGAGNSEGGASLVRRILNEREARVNPVAAAPRLATQGLNVVLDQEWPTIQAQGFDKINRALIRNEGFKIQQGEYEAALARIADVVPTLPMQGPQGIMQVPTQEAFRELTKLGAFRRTPEGRMAYDELRDTLRSGMGEMQGVFDAEQAKYARRAAMREYAKMNPDAFNKDVVDVEGIRKDLLEQKKVNALERRLGSPAVTYLQQVFGAGQGLGPGLVRKGAANLPLGLAP